jgi:hypothetical protein
MTSQILPFNGPSTPSGSSRKVPFTRGDRSEPTTFESELAASDRVLWSKAGGAAEGLADGGVPPTEVLDQIAAAGRISRQLGESGHELRFSEGEGGRVKVELADSEGNTVKSMSVSEALEIAAGKPLE